MGTVRVSVALAFWVVPLLACGVRPPSVDVKTVPPDSNGYHCQCVCTIPAGHHTLCGFPGSGSILNGDGTCVLPPQDQRLCYPPELNPNSAEAVGHVPTEDELIADCQGRIQDSITDGARFAYAGSDPVEACASSCSCSVRRNPAGDISTFTEAKCNEVCPSRELVRTVESPFSNIERATFVPESARAVCGGAGDSLRVCTPPRVDPPSDPPDGLFASAFGTLTAGDVTVGTGSVTIGTNASVTTALHGRVEFVGHQCTASRCDVPVRIDLQAADFVSGVVSYSGVGLLGAAAPAGLMLDTTGAGVLGPGSMFVTARGTGTRPILGVPVSSTRAVFLSNTADIVVHLDRSARTFTLEDDFAVPAGPNPDDAPAVNVRVNLRGTLVNQPPRANAGPDQVVECTSPTGTPVSLDGMGSTDSDSNIISYLWRRLPATSQLAGAQPLISTNQSLGLQRYGLVVLDSYFQTSGDDVEVRVADTIPPVVTEAKLERACLWPPNHKYVAFTLGRDLRAAATDACSGAATVVRIEGVTSDQPDDAQGLGDGATTADVRFGPLGFCLRAERAGARAEGRRYTVRLVATDESGLQAHRDVVVEVPHDQRANCPPLSASDFLEDDEALTRCSFPEPPAQPVQISAELPTLRPPTTVQPVGCSTTPAGGPSAGLCLLAWFALRITRRTRRFGSAALLLAVLLASCGAPATVETLAGSDRGGFHDGVGADAIFDNPADLIIDGEGVLFVSDRIIRRIDPGGAVTSFSGDRSNSGLLDGPAESALFFGPAGLAIDGAGHLFVADSGNHALRRVDLIDGRVATLAGDGVAGFSNGALGDSRFEVPLRIAYDRVSQRAYVSEFRSHTIRVVDLEQGRVSNLAGSDEAGYADGLGAAARFNTPRGLAVDPAGVLWVADTGNHVIRRVTAAGEVTTVAGLAGAAGSVDGAGASARLNGPWGLAATAQGGVYVTEPNNHLIRLLSATGGLRRFAGKPLAEGATATSEDGPLDRATFAWPGAITVGPDGAVYVADQRRVRVIR